ncbi:hypothetical protein QZH46_20425 [Pseudomonas corrugata]
MSHPREPVTHAPQDNPNDDGWVLGTAGRDEDPNAAPAYAIDRRHERDELTPEDARGLPGYPEKKRRPSQLTRMPPRQSRESRRLSRGTIRSGETAFVPRG